MEFIIFDMEYTTWLEMDEVTDTGQQKREIVQIAAIKVDAMTLEVTGELNLYVRPKFNPVLSEYFIDFTGITNDKLKAEGLDFARAYKKFRDFVGELICFSHSWGQRRFSIAEGEVVNENLKMHGMKEKHIPRYKNIARWFMQTYRDRGVDIKKQSSGQIATLLGRAKEMERHGLKGYNAFYNVYSVLEGLRYLGFRPITTVL